MKAFVFPGQGAQFPGMGKELYEKSELARELFEQADSLLGFKITDIMFGGTEEELRQTRVTQPAIFLHSTILSFAMGNAFRPDMVAGHSLGEFSALVANRTISFSDGLLLVSKRASAMQKACEKTSSTMAAVIGLEDEIIERVCESIDDIVVAANYNCPGQVVISGTIEGIDKAIGILKAKGAKRCLKLSVSGAFHSPLMEPAREELEDAINTTRFEIPECPVYQNVTGKPSVNPDEIKKNLILQLTSPVKWTQSVMNMISDGATTFIEVGPGTVLQGLIKKVSGNVITESAAL